MADIAEEIASSLIKAPAEDQPVEAAPNAEPQPSETPQQPLVEQPQPERPEPGFVPIQGMLDERDKRQKAERERDELKAWRQQQEAQRQQPQQPSPYDDPDGWAAAQELKLRQTQWDTTRAISHRFAVTQHGGDTVSQAEEWAQQQLGRDPTLLTRFQTQQDPVGWLVSEFKRDRLLSEIGDDPDAYARRRYAELEAGSATQPVPAQAGVKPQPAPPPRSLAAAPGSNSADAQPKDVFGGLKFNLD